MCDLSGEFQVSIRKAEKHDMVHVFEMIKELASFEKLEDQVKIDHAVLEKDGFGEGYPFFGCLVANLSDQTTIGYALYYHSYSTWEGKAIFLEDLYVKPAYSVKNCKNVIHIPVPDPWEILKFVKNYRIIEYYELMCAKSEGTHTESGTILVDRHKATSKFVEEKLVDTKRHVTAGPCMDRPKLGLKVPGQSLKSGLLYLRKHGVGKKLFLAVMKTAYDSGFKRVDFHVLSWNPAIDFYKRMGAVNLSETENWSLFRMNHDSIQKLFS